MYAKAWTQLSEAERWQWTQLVEQQAFNPSLAPDWLDAIINSSPHVEAQSVRVIVTEQGFLPYFEQRPASWPGRLAGTHLQLAGNLLAYNHAVVCESATAEQVSCQRQLLQQLLAGRERRSWLLSVNAIEADSALAVALQAEAKRLSARVLYSAGERSPWLTTEQSWSQFLASKGRDFRYGLQRKRKQLAAAGKIDIEWYTGGEWQALWQAMQAIESHSWKRADGSAITSRPEEMAYYTALLPWLAGSGRLCGTVLSINANPAAYSLCYRAGSEGQLKLGQLKTSFDDRYRAFSPGGPLLEAVIRHAFESGYSEFDFHGPAMPHKLRWSKRVRAFRNYYLYGPGTGSRLLAMAKRLSGRLAE